MTSDQAFAQPIPRVRWTAAPRRSRCAGATVRVLGKSSFLIGKALSKLPFTADLEVGPDYGGIAALAGRSRGGPGIVLRCCDLATATLAVIARFRLHVRITSTGSRTSPRYVDFRAGTEWRPGRAPRSRGACRAAARLGRDFAARRIRT